jgi:hypothetical protein
MHASDDPRCTCLLMRRAARRITQLYDEHLRPAGLKTSQFSLLANLRQADGVAMGELADRLSMDRTTLTAQPQAARAVRLDSHCTSTPATDGAPASR